MARPLYCEIQAMSFAKKFSGVLFVVLWSVGTSSGTNDSQDVLHSLQVVHEDSLAGADDPAASSNQGLAQTQESTQDILTDEDLLPVKNRSQGWREVPANSRVPSEDLNDKKVKQNSTSQPENSSISRNVDALFDKNSSYVDVPYNVSMYLFDYEDQDSESNQDSALLLTFIQYLSFHDPVYVNLTGIRDFTGRERMVTRGYLNLSGLHLTGEEAEEVIRRMSKYQFDIVDLSYNNISVLPINTFRPVRFMVLELRVDGNPLTDGRGLDDVIRRDALFNLPELRELNLSNSGLTDIDMFMPWNSDYLEVLDLSNNKLREVPSKLQFFHKLDRLYLANNPITEMKDAPFELLWNLQVLDLSNCLLENITGDPFKNLDNLEELNLSGNKLTHMSDVLPSPASWEFKLYLSGNPWHCDCNSISFVQWYFPYIADLKNIQCSSPWWVQDLHVMYLTKEMISTNDDCQPLSDDVIKPQLKQVTVNRTIDLLGVSFIGVYVLAVTVLLLHEVCVRKRSKDNRPLIVKADP